MRQGVEGKAGSKHSLLHFEITSGSYIEEEFLLIEDVLANGDKSEHTRRGVVVYEYNRTINGVEYTVITESDKRREVFADFYTNRTSSAARQTHSEEAQVSANGVRADKDTANSSEMQENV